MANPKTVLIVDDEPDAVEYVEAVLGEFEELTVISANNGETGLAKAQQLHPDLIILDVQMPGMTGFDVFIELKRDEATQDIRMLMLTGVAEKTGIRFSAEDMAQLADEEPDAYIEKPVEPAELKAVVGRLLGL